MIWHIFKKDLELMWKPILAVACIQVAFVVIQLRLESVNDSAVLQQLSQVLLWLWLMASAILTIAVVHQDAVPSTKQDWLTRPVGRIDLLVEKILFVFLMVQGPSIVTDLVQGFVNGFATWQTIGATLARAIIVFLALTLPALALGSVTEGVTEAVVLVMVAVFGVFAFTMIAIGVAGGYGHQFDPTDFTGEGWLTNAIRFLFLFIGGGFALLFQYQARKTKQTRILLGSTLLVLLFSQFIPWKPVFAMQKAFSPAPALGNSVAMIWQMQPDADRQVAHSLGRTENRLFIPLSVIGLPTDTLLKADKSEVSISDQHGARLYVGTGEDVEIRNDPGKQSLSYKQTIQVPPHVFQALEHQAVSVNITYSMTLFKLQSSYALRATEDNQRMPGWGLCHSRINENETAIEVSCIQIGKGPTCASVFLEHIPSGDRNPENTACYPDYSPFKDRPIPDVMTRFRLILPFRDISGLTKYPVDATRLAESRIIIRMYEPQDHFTRIVASPLLRIKDSASGN